MKRKIITMLIALICTSFSIATYADVAEKNKPSVKKGKGYIAIRVIGPKGRLWFDPEDRSKASFMKLLGKHTQVKVGSKKLKVFKLDGNTLFKMATFFPKEFKGEKWMIYGSKLNFTVEPGVVQYVGDVYLEYKNLYTPSVKLSIQVKDEEEKALEELRKNEPELLKKYEYKKHLMQ